MRKLILPILMLVGMTASAQTYKVKVGNTPYVLEHSNGVADTIYKATTDSIEVYSTNIRASKASLIVKQAQQHGINVSSYSAWLIAETNKEE